MHCSVPIHGSTCLAVAVFGQFPPNLSPSFSRNDFGSRHGVVRVRGSRSDRAKGKHPFGCLSALALASRLVCLCCQKKLRFTNEQYLRDHPELQKLLHNFVCEGVHRSVIPPLCELTVATAAQSSSTVRRTSWDLRLNILASRVERRRRVNLESDSLGISTNAHEQPHTFQNTRRRLNQPARRLYAERCTLQNAIAGNG